MAKTLTMDMTPAEARELQTLIDYYLAEMKGLNSQMARDQERIDSLKAETGLIRAETRAMLEGLQGALADLRAT